MIITIQDKTFDTAEITQLYPAAMVKTGYDDETTQVSLEWLDTEAKGKVEVVGFAIFVHLKEDVKHSFMFDDKRQMDQEIGKIAQQFDERKI